MTSSRAQRALFGVALAAGLLVALAPVAHAQLTVTIGPYPQSQQTAPVPGQPAPPPSSPYPYGRGGIAQAVAYAQYLQYVQAMNYAALRGGSASDVAQYFTNGATATTVPSAGQPGGAYFANGAEATVLRPPVPASAAPPLSPPPPPPQASPYPFPFIQAPPQGPPIPRAAAEPPPPPPVITDVAPPPPPSAEVVEGQPPPAPVAAMSFEGWLASMGITPTDDAPEPPSTAAPDEITSVSEPSAMAAAIQRTAFAPREKTRRRTASGGGEGGLVAAIGAAFAAGLLLGGFAMMRLHMRRRDAAPTVEPSILP